MKYCSFTTNSFVAVAVSVSVQHAMAQASSHKLVQAGQTDLLDLMRPKAQSKGQQTLNQQAVLNDPKGRAWPSNAGYLKDLPLRATGGPSTLTIDNTNGGSNVYAKLCTDRAGKCIAVRHVYVPQGASFTIRNIEAGKYDVRYRDLNNGQIAQSDVIHLREVVEGNTVRFSNVRLTLYTVRGGNTSFSPIGEESF